MKSVAVVGANGFIGSALVHGLSQSGYNPITITRNSNPENYDLNIIFYVAGSCTPHNAAQDAKHIEFDLQSLTDFLNRLKNINPRPLFVFASSAGVVYNHLESKPHSESSPVVPANLYGRCKLDQEAIVRQTTWVDSLILRLANIYGPNQKAKPGFGVIANWAKNICNNNPIEIIGNSQRDYLHINDLVELALVIMQNPQSVYAGLTVNVGSGNMLSLENLYEAFQKVTERPIQVIKQPARTFDANYVSLDISLAKKLFNWQPTIPIDKGIKGVLESACASRV